MGSRHAILWVFAICSAFLLTPMSVAQVDTGSIHGTVIDQTGAVVAGADVSLNNQDTGLTLHTTTASDGAYTFSPVKIGRYNIIVTAPGFATAQQNNVTVDVQQKVLASFRLQPGKVSETVEVKGEAPQLQTQESSVGLVATQTQINNLPLVSRNYTFLAQLSPGVTTITTSPEQNGRGLEKTGSFSANGMNEVYNNYILDGIDNNNDTVDFLNGASYVNLPPPDAIQEFKIQTSNFSAEFGRAGGAVINATVKSGTNQFHGDIWEFFRNDKLDAMPLSNYFLTDKSPKGELRYNQFGGAAGAPIIKNKTFIFGDYQGTIIRQALNTTASVPTAAEANSGFSDFRDQFQFTNATRTDLLGRTFLDPTILDPATTRAVTSGQVDPVTGLVATGTGYVRDPFYTGSSIAGITDFTTPAQQAFLNQLPTIRIDPNVIKILGLYPTPNQPGVVSNYVVPRSQPDNTHHFDVRVDQIFSTKDQAFGRVSYSHRSAFFPGSITGLGDNAGFGQGNFLDKSLNFALSETHVFSPTLINQARFGMSRLRTTAAPPSASVQGVPAQFGIQGIPQGSGNGGLPEIDISGLTNLGAGAFASPNQRVSNTIQLTDDLTKVHGSHTFKGGFEYQSMHFPWVDPAWSRGDFSFGGYTGVPGQGGGLGMADILLTPTTSSVAGGVDYVGGPNTVFASNITQPQDFRHYYGAYFQDDWRTTSKLTLNLGLRWEYFGAIGATDAKQAALIPGDVYGKGAQYLILAGSKNSTPLSQAFINQLATDHIALNYVNGLSVGTAPKTNFAPRLGLAYQITSKLVARAGYGIFYAGFENLGGAPDPGYNYPFAVNLGFFRNNDVSPIVYPNGQRATLEAGLTAADPNPASPNFNPEGLGVTSFQRPWTTAYNQQWNGAVQYQLSQSQTITFTYLGSNSHHLLDGNKRNLPTQILPPNTDQTPYVPFPDFSKNFDYVAADGSGTYHALQVAFERRFSAGLNLLANYTRSKCMIDQKNILGTGEGFFFRAPTLPGFGLKPDYHYCGNDTPNLLHFSGVWELPIGRGKMVANNVNRVVNGVIGGWSVQWIYDLQNGFPFNIGCATATTSGFGCEPIVSSSTSVYQHSTSPGSNCNLTTCIGFLNAAAFTNPPLATAIGQTDYSVLGGRPYQGHGPTYNDLDFSLFKHFKITETKNFEFRGEFFNFLNHPNFCNCFLGTNFTNTKTFGILNGTRGTERQVQLGLKFYW